MNKLFFIACFIIATVVWGQTTTTRTGRTFYGSQYSKPQFPGDVKAFVAKNKHYPGAAREGGVEGRVIVNFMVTENGDITDVKVIRSIGSGCDEEAARIVKAMPSWIPATYKGKPVNAIEQVHIIFKLE